MAPDKNQVTTDSPADNTAPTLAADAHRFATVLQVLPALNAHGGVERGTVEIADAIVQSGGRALVASAGGPMVHDLTRVRATHIELPLHTKNPYRMYKNIDRLVDLIRREKVDLVHARSRAPAWSAFFAAKRAGVPFITTFHGTYNGTSSLKRLYNSVMVRGQRVIAISGFIGGHVRRFYGVANEKIRVIPRGVDVERFSPEHVSAQRIVALADAWRLADGHSVVALPGRLTRWKGQTVFIEAIRLLNRRDIRCILIGSDQGREDYRRELEQMIARYELGPVMRLVDHCSDMPAAYMLSDIVVSASTDPEAFGRVMVEGQSLGRPVIATDHGGARETVIEGETGWRVPPGDAEALAKAISEALDMSEDRRRKMAEAAIQNVRKNFSKAQMCARTLDVYNEVLDVKGS